MRFKKLIAIFIAILMMFSTSIPTICAYAANTRTPIGKTGYNRFKIGGNDAYCINVNNESGDEFTSSAAAYDYWDSKLTATEKDNVELAITAAHILGYYNDTATEYLAVQRYIWHQTNPVAVQSKNIEKENMASTQYKKLCDMVNKLKRIRNFTLNSGKTVVIPTGSTYKLVDITPSSDATTKWGTPTFTGTGKNYFKYSKSGDNGKFSLKSVPSGDSTVTAKATFTNSLTWYGNTAKSNFYKSDKQEVIYLATKKKAPTKSITVKYTPKTPDIEYYGSLTIAKNLKYFDSNGNVKYKGLNGITFDIEYPKGTRIDSITTRTVGDAVGVATLNNIYLGETSTATKTVWVKEHTPDDSVPADGQTYHQVTIRANQTTRVVTRTDSNGGTKYVNVEKYGDFVVHKVINDIDENGQIKMENGQVVFKIPSEVYPSNIARPKFKFKLTKKDDSSVVFYRETNDNGNAFFCNIPLGTYYLEEITDSNGKFDSKGQYVNKNASTSNSDKNGKQKITIIWDGQRNYNDTPENGYNSSHYLGFQGRRIYVDNDNTKDLLYVNHTGVGVKNESVLSDSDVDSIVNEPEIYDEETLDNDDYEDAGEIGDDETPDDGDEGDPTDPDDQSHANDDALDGINTDNDANIITGVINSVNDNGLYHNYYNVTKQWYAEFRKVDSKTLSGPRGHATLEGAVYGLFRTYNGETKKVAEYTTDNNGVFTTELFTVVGNYFLKELTPSKGYTLDKNTYPVFSETTTNVSSWDDVTKLSNIEGGDNNLLPEEGIESKIEVYKYDSEYPDNLLTGAEFTVYDDVNENQTFDEDDVEITKLNEDSEGHYISEELPYGHYLIKETKAPEGFNVDEIYYPVFIEEHEKTYTVTNNGECFIDTPIKGFLEVYKYDSEYPDNVLSGAEFTVYEDANANGEYDKDEKEIAKLSESEEKIGYYKSEAIRYGHYLVKETKAPEGFNVDEKYYPVFIEEHDKTYEVTNNGECFIDTPIKGYIDVLKFDKDYPDNKLKGAEFTVYDDTNANGKYDKGEKELTKLSESKDTEGYYKSEALRYGHYLVRETKAPTGYTADDNYYPVFIEEHDKTYSIKNNSKGFADKRIRGTVVITKTDVVNGQVIEGAKIEILDENKKVIASGITSKKGTVTFTLDYGTYYFRESGAPKGYVLDSSLHKFSITKDGQILKLTLTNDPISNPHAVKTGTNIAIVCAIVLVVIAAILLIIYLKKKRNEDNN